MKSLTAIIVLSMALCAVANADVWKWMDALGETHYVDTITPIYTWQDDHGKVHYSDKPDHPDAVAVQLVWHSRGSLTDVKGSESDAAARRGKNNVPDETVDDRIEREMAEAYYCKRVTEIYESYLNAPNLYRTNDEGEKEYLSEEEQEATLIETKAKVEELCG